MVMCEHRFIEVVGTKLDFEKSDNGRIETTVRRKACHKCYKTKTEIELEQQLAAANARVAELKADMSALEKTRCAGYDAVTIRAEQAEARVAELEQDLTAQDMLIQEAKNGAEAMTAKFEQAEAQCAAMRLRFEKYVRGNCKLIRHSVADGLDKPDEVEGECGGYCQNFDEPHQICQECIAAYDPEAEYNDEVTDAGTAILADNKRMREALERCGLCRDYSHEKVKCYHDYEGHRPPQATCDHPEAGFKLVDWAALPAEQPQRQWYRDPCDPFRQQ